MTKPFVFEKPMGMRDTLPHILEKKIKVMSRIQEVTRTWGYEQIETPTLEYYDTVGGVSSTLEQKCFKLLDRSGRSLVLRPDMTAPIARVVGSLLKEQVFPIRLSYQGHVFRAQEKEAGRNSEFPEVGVELIGEEAPDADGEVIALAISALQASGVKDFRLTIGHAGFIHKLFKQFVQDENQEKKLKQYLFDKDYVGYRYEIEQSALEEDNKRALLQLLSFQGGMTFLSKVRELSQSPGLQKVIQELEDLCAVLEDYGVIHHLFFDLSLMREMDYYTGVHFEIYAANLGFPIGNGGRYDNLLAQFGRPAPAIGFSLKVDRILEVSEFALKQTQRKVVISYTEAERKQAVHQAMKVREEGNIAILYPLKSIEERVTIAGDERISLERGGVQVGHRS